MFIETILYIILIYELFRPILGYRTNIPQFLTPILQLSLKRQFLQRSQFGSQSGL